MIIFFRKRIWGLILSLLGKKEYRTRDTAHNDRMIILYLIIATAVTGLVYQILGNPIESLYHKPLVVAFMLIITGIIVFASDYVKKGNISATKDGVTTKSIYRINSGYGYYSWNFTLRFNYCCFLFLVVSVKKQNSHSF